MKRSGYSTAIVGKWHLGFRTDEKMDWNKELAPGPLELGFDYYFGVPILNSHPPFVYVENHHVVGYDPNDPFVRGKRAETEEFDEKFGINSIGGATAAHRLYKDRAVATTLKDRAVQWIKEHKDSPFFLYYATTNIHHPFTPAERFVGTSEAGPYGDSIHELDWVVGEIMRTLDEEGLAGNTLLIFTSDNGGMLNHGGQRAWKAGHHINGKLLGFKFGAWEGGHRIPMIVRWPGIVAPQTQCDHYLMIEDFFPTILEMAGVDNYTTVQQRDGISFMPLLTGKGKMKDRDIYWHYPNSWGPSGPGIGATCSIRSGEWKLVYYFGDGRRELFNIPADISEKHDMAREKPEVVKELSRKLSNYLRSVDAQRPLLRATRQPAPWPDEI